ncbi:MAG: hypothetical protein HN975_09580 [Anaerolineae bacterium]|nr:hypothetical protein [Anaerolineae bacterium]
MPYYGFRCQSCSLRFELKRDVDQRDDPGQCPECQGMKISRMFSIPATFSISSDGSMASVGASSSCGSCTSTSCGPCGDG